MHTAPHMKKLMLFMALAASVWSSFSHSAGNYYYNCVVKQSGTTRTGYTVNPTSIVTDTTDSLAALSYVQESVNITDPNGGSCYFPDAIGWNINCANNFSGLFLSCTKTTSNEPPTNTCKNKEGAFIDGYHNSITDFCANIGDTGGTSPEPLLCTATNLAELPAGSGNFQHTVTAESCSAPNGPVAPEGENPDPCTENCEPIDPPPTSGNDGSEIPSTGGSSSSSTTTVTGTQTDSQGSVTNISMTMEQDLTPVTERLNETNQRLKAENENSSTIIDRLNELLHGTTKNGSKLDGIKDAINGLDTSTDMSGVESKLDAVKGSIDGIADRFGSKADGEFSGNDVNLPDYQAALDDGMAQVDAIINSEANNEKTNGLSAIGDELTAFDSLPELFEFASENCSPIPWGQNNSLDLCPYAPDIAGTLDWFFIMLTVIFIIGSVIADIKNMRLSA